MENLSKISLDELITKSFSCDCGEVHKINAKIYRGEYISSLKTALSGLGNNGCFISFNYTFKDFDKLSIELDYDMSKYTSKELKYCVVAIVKEALTNTVKHSNATAVKIVLREHPALYQLLIEDNGTLSASEKNDKTGIGLDNMRERVSAFNGNMLISREQGFKIFISIPKEN
jgi:signal transduction histidine kinase